MRDALSPLSSSLAAHELVSPERWRVIDFISDLHLQASEPATLLAWERYLSNTQADAVFTLGDLFEVWVGDDVLDGTGFESHCAQMLAQAARRLELFFMHGNRDFLLGTVAANACRMRLLHDPCVLQFGLTRYVLSHGDELCLDDHDYLQFRAQVRSPAWQQAFLAKPLPKRQAIARGLRDASETRKKSGLTYADVDVAAARQWLVAAQASILIHGHTHRPAHHDLSGGLQRAVLSDWDLGAAPARAEVLRLSLDQGLQRISLFHF